MNGSPPPAAVVVTSPIELVGADDTVPPTELLVVSRLLVVALTVVVVAPLVEVAPEVLVAPLVVVGLTVVVVAPLVEVAPEVLVAPLVVVGLTVVVVAPVVVVGFTVVVVAPLVVVGLTVVVVAPLVEVAPEVLVAPLVVVGWTVVVVAPLVVVGLTVVVVAPVLVVGLTVVVVAPVLVVGYTVVVVDSPVVVVPPELVAEASCPTLTPATTIKVTAISQAAARLRTFLACLAIAPTFWVSARPLDRAHLQGKQAATHPVSVRAGMTKSRTWRLTGRLEAASALPRGDLQGEGGNWGIGGHRCCSGARAPPPQKTAGNAGRHNRQANSRVFASRRTSVQSAVLHVTLCELQEFGRSSQPSRSRTQRPGSCGFDSSGRGCARCPPVDTGPSRGGQVGQLAPVVAMIGQSFPGLLRAAVGGDQEAFGRLWYDLQPRLLRYFGVIAPEAAEDLASETWVGVIRGIGRFQGSEPAFRGWVFTIARNKVLDWRRRAARRPTQDLPVTELAEPLAPDDPAAAAMEGASTRAALALIATLPTDQAEAIALRVIAGLEVCRVAEIMDKRPGAVRVLTHRGLRRLAQQLGADWDVAARRVR